MKKGEKKMKKNIEWLKKEIATEMIELEPNRKERWSDVKYQTLRSVAQKLDQLDEPEALSKEWVNNNVVHVRGLGDIFEAETVENLLVPKQELPVIPKYVADWIEETKERGYPLAYAINCSKGELGKWLHECDTDIETEENQELFAEAWLYGYEMEEEPLYFALIKGHELIDDGGMFWNFDMFDEKVIISPLNSPRDSFLTKMSKEDWNKLGINDSNADFVKVGEVK